MFVYLQHTKHSRLHSIWQEVSIVEVALHQLLFEFGRNLLSLSLPFYLIKTLGYSLPEMFIFYFFWQVPHTIIGPYIQSYIKSFGLKHSIAMRSWTSAFFWLLIPLGLQGDLWMDIMMLLPLFCIRALGIVTSEVAYDVFLLNHATKNHSGRTMGLMRAMTLLATIAAPIIGGFITYVFGLEAGALASTAAFMASGAIMLFGKDEQINVEYSAKQISTEMHHIPKQLVLGQIGIIAPSLVMWLFWPAFLALILPNIASLGVFSAVSTLVATLLALKLGNSLDKKGVNAQLLLQRGGLRNIGCSLLRFVWIEPIGFAITDALYKINMQTLYLPYVKSLLEWQRKDSLRRSHIRWLSVENIYTSMIGICAVVLNLVEHSSILLYASIFIIAAILSLLTAQVAKLQTA